MVHRYTGQIGTFVIVTRDTGFVVRDTCAFNHWPDSKEWPTRNEAESHACSCRDFKEGRRFVAP